MTLRRSLYGIYWWLEGRITPGLQYSQTIYEEVLKAQVEPGTEWLDLGCGRRLLPPWRQAEEAVLLRRAGLFVGTDLDLDSLKDNKVAQLRIMADAGQLPFRRESFNLVSANMVVEHLATPDRQLIEISRVVRPGGRIIFITPNADGFPTLLTRWFPDVLKRWGARLLEGRAGQDVFPAFYRLNTVEAVTRLAAQSGLRIVKIDLICSTAQFAQVPPLAALELCWIRLMRASPALTRFRPVLIAVLEKPATGEN